MGNQKKVDQQERFNLNRGYQKLRVWQDSISLFGLFLKDFKGFSFEFKKIAPVNDNRKQSLRGAIVTKQSHGIASLRSQ